MKLRKRTVSEFIQERMYTGQVKRARMGPIILEYHTTGSLHYIRIDHEPLNLKGTETDEEQLPLLNRPRIFNQHARSTDRARVNGR